jgi:hypothetical protein
LYVAGGAHSKSATALWAPILAILSITRVEVRETGRRSVNSRLLAKIGDDALF